MKYFKPFMPFIACWILLFNSNNFQSVALINGIGQLVLFLFVVCIPIWKTGRMSYVDIGWPWGVALLYTSRIMYITLVYLTGAVPSEYYSAQKRPSFKAYQQSTNIFFPGPKKA